MPHVCQIYASGNSGIYVYLSLIYLNLIAREYYKKVCVDVLLGNSSLLRPGRKATQGQEVIATIQAKCSKNKVVVRAACKLEVVCRELRVRLFHR